MSVVRYAVDFFFARVCFSTALVDVVAMASPSSGRKEEDPRRPGGCGKREEAPKALLETLKKEVVDFVKATPEEHAT